MSEGFVEVEGGQLFYEEAGSGPRRRSSTRAYGTGNVGDQFPVYGRTRRRRSPGEHAPARAVQSARARVSRKRQRAVRLGRAMEAHVVVDVLLHELSLGPSEIVCR
jgi:hypothetical protein